MSIHKSLKSNKYKDKRSVHKRYERIRSLILKKKWDKEHDSVYGLPKEKIIRYKIKKEKKEEKEGLTPIAEYENTTETKKMKKKSKDVGKIK